MENFNNKTWLDYSVYCGEKLQLYHGDCLEVMDLMIEDKTKVDMILCDLPYGTTACKWDTIIPFEDLWERYEKLIKPNGAIVLTASQPFTSALVMSNLKLFKYEWVWDKVNKYTGFLQASTRPLKRHENILIFSKSKTTFNKQMVNITPYSQRKSKNYGKKETTYRTIKNESPNKINETSEIGLGNPFSIIQFKSQNPNVLHPTQKPVELMEYLIKTYTNEGETVLDNCIGSGTTAVACINTDRYCIGIEKDKPIYDIAVKRLNDIWISKQNKNELF
ncbi:MAG: site-specific DNA-methyltransferase [Chitinophagaceae bacterium]|nr:site-specific DNA-methyltransferase [Chitinophagaceae bacterium]MBP8116073.1 site-specific DNA-methyltransferase [Chitinophagaceae bacterium]